MAESLTQDEKVRRGAEDAGRYFRYMMDFVGFGPAESRAVRESALVIEKYIPSIVADFYAHLLRYPPTRESFIDKAGKIDQDYLQKRMAHLANFWRRTASGEYDDDYARYVDYVGRAHTRQGADPNIYIAERYVIGQAGFMQRAISEALTRELHEVDPDLEARAVRAWNMIMMVILETLARAYSSEHEGEHAGEMMQVNRESVEKLAVQAYEMDLGLGKPPTYQQFPAARVDEIPEGERKIVQIGEHSIGIFHHRGGWYALRNSCLHRGGPVAAGELHGDTLTCPWHGYQYSVTTGELLVDPSAKLESYPLEVRDGQIYLTVPSRISEPVGDFFTGEKEVARPALRENEFLPADLPEGRSRRVSVGGEAVAVYHVGGRFYATADACTHAGGPLSEGDLEGMHVICPWHDSCFDISSGAVCRGPATEPVRAYRVVIENGIGRVEA